MIRNFSPKQNEMSHLPVMSPSHPLQTMSTIKNNCQRPDFIVVSVVLNLFPARIFENFDIICYFAQCNLTSEKTY